MVLKLFPLNGSLLEGIFQRVCNLFNVSCKQERMHHLSRRKHLSSTGEGNLHKITLEGLSGNKWSWISIM